MYACMYLHMDAHTHTHTHTHMYPYIYINTYILYIYIYIYRFIHTFTYVCIYVYVFLYLHMHAYIALHCKSLDTYITIHYVALPYVTLCYVTLRCIHAYTHRRTLLNRHAHTHTRTHAHTHTHAHAHTCKQRIVQYLYFPSESSMVFCNYNVLYICRCLGFSDNGPLTPWDWYAGGGWSAGMAKTGVCGGHPGQSDSHWVGCGTCLTKCKRMPPTRLFEWGMMINHPIWRHLIF